MPDRAQIRMISDGRRLHMQDGPIDLIVHAFGEPSEIDLAYRAAAGRFTSVLDELCGELPFLRRQVCPEAAVPSGAIARRMLAAVLPYASQTFITPMAAVAGAVAEEILGVMTSVARLSRAYVNDGGDIALYLAPGEEFVVGMVELPNDRTDRGCLFGTTTIQFSDPVRGIATSGWRGRSLSLGIADAVTVLADTAARADAAATIVANAVDLPGHPQVRRTPACEIAPDSDLGERLVTQSVGELSPGDIEIALQAGSRVAEALCASRLIRAAALNLRGETRVIGTQLSSQLVSTPASDRRAVHA